MEVVAWLALALAGMNSVLLLLVVREVGVLKIAGSRKSGLRFNTRLPQLTALSLAGTTITSEQIWGRVLLFVSPECERCHDLASDLSRLAPDGIPPLVVGVSSRGEPEEAQLRTEFAFLPPDRIFVDPKREIFGELEVPGTPYAYVVNGSGRIRGSGVVGSVAELQHLATAL